MPTIVFVGFFIGDFMFVDTKYNEINYVVPEGLDGELLKHVLRTHIGISSHLMKKLKTKEAILVNGENTRVIDAVKSGDYISLDISEATHLKSEDIEIEVLYEDADLIAVNKPPFMVVHPTRKHVDGTLLNGIIYYLHSKGELVKPHLVSRLDRDTSGVIIVAKNSFAQSFLIDKMSENRVKKKYTAIVEGRFEKKRGLIDLPIGREEVDGIKRIVTEEGKRSKTKYKVLSENANFSLVELELLTGRTHQIRVHLSHLGHPIVGDELYGSSCLSLINRQALHASSVRFESPRTSVVTVNAPLPEDMKRIIEETSYEKSIVK